jgi:hypothetical protein
MGFQWGWDKRLPRTIGGGGLILLGIFAILLGWPLLLLIFSYIYVIGECVWQFVLRLLHGG